MTRFTAAPPDDDDDHIDKADQAQRHREKMAARSREQFEAVSDIGEIPAVVNPERRESCRLDLAKFLQVYFPHSTGLTPLSPDHTEKVIPRIQGNCLKGGRSGNAVYRGFAKTTITENSAIWAVLYGHRRYPAIFGNDRGAAARLIDSIKTELQDNDLLYEDFPEVCHAVRALEGKPQRCRSQTHNGNLTHIAWTAEKIVLPTIEGSAASGAVLSAHGLTAASRGLKHKRPDGTNQRPDWAIIDDPQTDETAINPNTVQKRVNLIVKNILKQSGHRSTIACTVNATVIARDDLVETLMDRKKHPSWQWIRVPMVLAFAKRHDDLWLEEYARIRNTFDPNDPDDQKRAWKRATEFYKLHRAEMDEGADVAWESCYDPEHEISAIQHAYNLLIDDGPEAFASECQQEPAKPQDHSDDLTPADILAKVVNLPRGVVPQDCHLVTAYMDVQGKALYYMVCAWGDGFRGHILDYGIYPQQPTTSLALAQVKRTLRQAHPKTGAEGAIRAGLDALAERLLANPYLREDSVAIPIDRCVADSGHQAPIIYRFCRESPYRRLLLPAKGEGIGPNQRAMTEFDPKPGQEIGLNWVKGPVGVGEVNILLRIDTNWWKRFAYERLKAAIGDPGSVTIFGPIKAKDPREIVDHGDLILQLVSESHVEELGTKGRVVWKWTRRPNSPDNHLWDCFVGCCVAASERKLRMEVLQAPKVKKKKLTSEEIRARREARRNG